MAAWIMCSVLLTWALFTNAYPLEDDRLTPEEIAAFLSERVMSQSTIPVEDSSFDTSKEGLGTVASVDVDSNGDLFVFHRADRPWTENTFEEASNKLTAQAREPISKDTIYKLDSATGHLISSFGANIFNVPHGLSIDAHDNIWVTDVGRHQVFRIPENASTPDLVLGEQFVPGSDDTHFCKPTDVAVATNGEFFISDGYRIKSCQELGGTQMETIQKVQQAFGNVVMIITGIKDWYYPPHIGGELSTFRYCNSRILKFSKDAKVIAQWGTQTTSEDLTPFTLNIPHSVTLVEELDLICVADRENSRALCYNAGLVDNKAAGTFNRTVVPEGDAGKVFAIDYNRADDEIVIASGIAEEPYRSVDDEIIFPPRAFTYTLDGQQKSAWAYITPDIARDGPSAIHDLVASKDGQSYYLADLDQQKVFKYTKSPLDFTA